MRRTILEIDMNKINNNINKIKKYTGNKEIMPVIKANAYGTYINENIDFLNQFNIVAVAIVEEGIKLREKGYQKEIMILNQPSIKEINEIEKYDLTIGISSTEFLNKVIEDNKTFKIHIEIETGMNRTGVKIENLENFIKKLKHSNLKVEGIYTHLSSADFDKDYTLNQIVQFETALKIIKKEYQKIKYIHVNASSGIINYTLPFTNLIRPGIIMYGYEPYKDAFQKIKLEPITVLKTEIVFIKECREKDAIGYSQKYICKTPKTIGTISIGYADGLRRELSNKGYVIVGNKKAPIVGNICMDSCMIDLTGIEAKVGDEVKIWDNDLIKVEEIAKMCNTINYEILSTISDRVPRIAKK